MYYTPLKALKCQICLKSHLFSFVSGCIISVFVATKSKNNRNQKAQKDVSAGESILTQEYIIFVRFGSYGQVKTKVSQKPKIKDKTISICFHDVTI